MEINTVLPMNEQGRITIPKAAREEWGLLGEKANVRVTARPGAKADTEADE